MGAKLRGSSGGGKWGWKQGAPAHGGPLFFVMPLTRSILPYRRRLGVGVLLATVALAFPGWTAAQTAATGPLEPPTARVAALPVALYTAQANLQEASDASKSGLATEVLLARLTEQLGPQLEAAVRVAAAAR